MSSNKKNNDKKKTPRPEKPSPKKSWEILETPKMRRQELQALRLLQRSMPKADRPGPLPKVDEWRRCGLQVAAVFKGLSGGTFSLLVKMSQIPFFGIIVGKKQNMRKLPLVSNHIPNGLFMWLQILCCSPPYLWATFAGAERPETKRFPLFFDFFRFFAKKIPLLLFLQKMGWCFKQFCAISFPQVSFHQAVEVGGLGSCSNVWWQKKQPVFSLEAKMISALSAA